jgi:hypothetical protein
MLFATTCNLSCQRLGASALVLHSTDPTLISSLQISSQWIIDLLWRNFDIFWQSCHFEVSCDGLPWSCRSLVHYIIEMMLNLFFYSCCFFWTTFCKLYQFELLCAAYKIFPGQIQSNEFDVDWSSYKLIFSVLFCISMSKSRSVSSWKFSYFSNFSADEPVQRIWVF